MTGLSIVIPSKNTSNLKICLRALRVSGESCRVVVVDDGLRERIDGCEYIEGIKPFIFARNCNLGIRAVDPDDVILLNDDAQLQSKGGFTLMQQSAEADSKIGIIGAVTNLTGQVLQRPRNTGGLRDVPHIAFVCVLLPRRTIERIGLLDERYCIDYGVEDRDYCEAVVRAGMKIAVDDRCFVDHASLTSTFRGHPTKPGSSKQNQELYYQKWGRG